MARHSRYEDIRSAAIRLEHYPTGIIVEGSIPSGHYTRKELVRLTKALRIELWVSLESKVAKALHLPRR